ncbi:PREDICTED: bcl-2-like protein 1, partial [Merops nubicus]|uniref:bcl-2-like protein 1 n=1 Tax=Merops nubicus TaxID=57421 RepID=UPI0004F00B5A
MSSRNRELVIDFVSYKLSQKGYSWSQLEEEDENRTDFAAEEAEMDGVLNGSPSWQPPAFSGLTSQRHITLGTAYQSFEQVVNELFRDGVNWGRIVAFFSFGGALCVESVDKEMRVLVGRIVSWMTTYLTDHLDPWIQENGGW